MTTQSAVIPQLSSFEKLPAEIQRMIFLECENSALFFTSKVLFDLVTIYKPLRKDIVGSVIKDPALERAEPNLAHEHLRQVLEQPWISFGLIWDCLIDRLAERCQLSIQKDIEWDSVIRELQIEILDWVTEVVHLAFKEHNSTVDFSTYMQFIPVPAIGSAFVGASQGSFNSVKAFGRHNIYVSAAMGTVTFNWRGARTTNHLISGRSIRIGSLAAIPSSLLRGPWTQQQGDVLTYFLRNANSALKPSREQSEDIQVGLTRILETRNEAALSVFFGQEMMEHLALQWINPVRGVVPSRIGDSHDWNTTQVFFAQGTRSLGLLTRIVRASLTPEQLKAWRDWLLCLEEEDIAKTPDPAYAESSRGFKAAMLKLESPAVIQ